MVLVINVMTIILTPIHPIHTVELLVHMEGSKVLRQLPWWDDRVDHGEGLQSVLGVGEFNKARLWAECDLLAAVTVVVCSG